MMRALCLFTLVFSTQIFAASKTISGEVTLSKGLTVPAGGALFVIAKEAGKPMPIAVLRIPAAKFPYKFSLGAENAMMAGAPFTGPYMITARYSPSGDAMDKSGPETTLEKPIAVGKSDLKLELKPKVMK